MARRLRQEAGDDLSPSTMAALTIIIWYFVTYRIVKRVALEWQK